MACLGLLPQVGEMCERVLMPPAVVAELAVDVPGLGCVIAVDWPFIDIVEPAAAAVARLGLTHHGRGEAAAIALAVERGVQILLVDDRGARLAATSCGLTPLGTLGLLVQAKHQGRIEAVSPLIDRLVKDIGFRISPAVRREVLRIAREQA